MFKEVYSCPYSASVIKNKNKQTNRQKHTGWEFRQLRVDNGNAPNIKAYRLWCQELELPLKTSFFSKQNCISIA